MLKAEIISIGCFQELVLLVYNDAWLHLAEFQLGLHGLHGLHGPHGLHGLHGPV